MVKGGGKKVKDDGGPSAEEQLSISESKRLRNLAVSRGLLSRSKANPAASLFPREIIRKCDGKDIVKKGHRKTKYLFAFPGLMAPIAGGKFGELTHLDSRNPTFYIDFPQGRLKLFGTIVYPKNKYLTMHFMPGRGDIVCEDCFESIVVFPEAWWIGTKEDNPGEVRLDMPSDLQQVRHEGYTFSAGAGEGRNSNAKESVGKSKDVTVKNDADSPARQFPVERFQDSQSPAELGSQDVPLRRSGRKQTANVGYRFSSAREDQSRESSEDSPDIRSKGRCSKQADKDVIPSQSSITAADTSAQQDVRASLTGQTIGEKTAHNDEMGTTPGTADAEWMQGTTAPRVHLKQGTLSAFFNTADALQSDGNKTRAGRGRGKGDTTAGTSTGQTNAPRRGNAKRLQSVTEISTSDEHDGTKEDDVQILDSQ